MTFTFSEAVADFTNDDVTVVGGTLDTLTSADGGITWRATFTASDDFVGAGSVTVTGVYSDLVGNIGATGATDTVAIDTENPSVAITDDEPGTANIAGGSIVYTFTFSQPVNGFTVDRGGCCERHQGRLHGV